MDVYVLFVNRFTFISLLFCCVYNAVRLVIQPPLQHLTVITTAVYALATVCCRIRHDRFVFVRFSDFV